MIRLPLSLMILSLIGLAGISPARAQVDVLPPVLQSISIDSTALVAGQQVRISYQANDASGVSFVSALYMADWGGAYSVLDEGTLTGELILDIPPTMPDGTYRFDSVVLYDTVDPRNYIIYRADGTATSESVGAPTTHDLDFSALNFTVSGNGPGDVLPPVLQSISIESTALTAGQQVRISYDASDASGVSFVSASFRATTGASYSILDEGTLSGELVLDILPTMPDGLYTFDGIVLYDGVSPRNYIIYNADGTAASNSVGAPTTHDLDFSALNFTVSGNGSVDVLPPVLEAISLEVSDLIAGQQVRIPYQASDESGVSFVSASYRAATGASYSILDEGTLTGELVLTVRPTMPDGVYTFDSVVFYDTVDPRNYIIYRADGSAASNSVDAPTTHDFNFSALNFTVTGNEFRAGTEEAPANPETPVEIEVTPVDELEGQGEAAPRADTGARAIFVSTTLGTLTAGGQSGTRIRAQSVGGGRYVAALRSSVAGQATLTAEVEGRVLPPLRMAFIATTMPTTTTLTGPTSGTVGQGLTFAARVATAGAGGPIPGGTVSFRRNGTPVATVALNASGNASVILTDLAPGTHQITAAYAGAAGFDPSISAARAVTVAAGPPVSFQGGGVVFGLTDACRAGGWAAMVHPVHVRYAPSEFNGLPSQVSIALPEGTEHLSLWGAMVPSALFAGGAGRQAWTQFLFYPRTPLIRVVQRMVTAPPGGTLAQAQELLVRLRVQNFSARVGCSATLVATLRRQG